MTNKQKDSYINAVKCLQRLPSIKPATGAKTRFDDFQAMHIGLTYEIHWVVCHISPYPRDRLGTDVYVFDPDQGQFLPYHRRFVQLYETTLREKCGYNGAQPLVLLLNSLLTNL